MNALLAAAAAFFLLHMMPGAPFRGRLIGLAGEGPYLGAFSILALATIWGLATAFSAAPPGQDYWTVPPWWLWFKAGLVLFAFILIVAGVLSPNPSSTGSAKALESPNAADGIFAITRHPLMWGIAIWAIAHMISQATMRGFVFFGTFAATALIGSWLQQRRKRATLPAWAEFEAKTSFVPFAAILQGRAKLSLKAAGWVRIAIATLIWALLLHFHFLLFGRQPLPIYS